MAAPAVAAIIAAIIAAGTSVVTTVLSNQESEEARDEAKILADIQRGDVLGTQLAQQRMTKAQLAQSESQFKRNLEQRQTEFGIMQQERARERLDRTKQQALTNSLGLLSSNQQLSDRVARRFSGGSIGRAA